MNHAFRFRELIPQTALTGLYDHWRQLAAQLGRLPRRSEIDPLDLPRDALSGMMILEREETGRILCRLAGTRMREIYGFEAAGSYLDEVTPPGAATYRNGIYQSALDGQRAVYCRLRLAVPGREYVASDRLYVPALNDQTGQPTILFGAQVFLMASEVVGEADEDGLYTMAFDDPAA